MWHGEDPRYIKVISFDQSHLIAVTSVLVPINSVFSYFGFVLTELDSGES